MAVNNSTRLPPSRRAFFIGGAAVLAGLKALPATPACTLIAEQEVGPYYIEDQTLRRNITEGRPGLPLTLRVALVDAKQCSPLPNAALDIWHCDALGVYSGFTANSPGGQGGRGPRGMRPPDGREQGFGPGSPPPPQRLDPAGSDRPAGRDWIAPPGAPPGARPADTSRFLRGVQLTDRQGIAEFTTLYPGWYAGRTIHIHLKVHLGGSSAAGMYVGGHVSHTGQLFLPEDVTDQVSKLEPYSRRLSIRRTLQSEDGIFNGQHGSASIVSLTRLSPGTNADGFIATVTLAVDPEAIPDPVGGPGGRRGPRPF